MGLFWISVKFLAWGLSPPAEGEHKATPSQPEEANTSPASGLSLNQLLRQIEAGEFARPAGSLAPSGSEVEVDGFSWEGEGANDVRLRRSFVLVLRFGRMSFRSTHVTFVDGLG